MDRMITQVEELLVKVTVQNSLAALDLIVEMFRYSVSYKNLWNKTTVYAEYVITLTITAAIWAFVYFFRND